MTRQPITSRWMRATAFTLIILAALSYLSIAATSPQSTAGALDKKAPPAAASTADQVKDLQRQVAELRTEFASQRPRIVAAGTATWKRPDVQDNRTATRVKLGGDITALLGESCIVLVSNRYPVGGYPWFVPYWKKANDGFDIYLADVEVGGGNTASYDNRNKDYLIDWVVVKK